jgi:hypothetical protein
VNKTGGAKPSQSVKNEMGSKKKNTLRLEYSMEMKQQHSRCYFQERECFSDLQALIHIVKVKTLDNIEEECKKNWICRVCGLNARPSDFYG